MIQFTALLSKELKKAFQGKYTMLSGVSTLMIRSAIRLVTYSVIYLAKGVVA